MQLTLQATTDTLSELYVVNVDSGTPGAAVAVNPPVVAGGALGQSTAPSYTDAKFSLSGDKVAFIGDLATDGEEEMWFVDLGGANPGAPVRVNPPYTLGTQDVDTDEYNFSPDGRWLWYIADEALDSEFNLYIVDTTASPVVSVQVNGLLPLNSDVDTLDGVRVSPDSTKIAYISDEGTAAVEQLYVVDLLVQPFAPQLVSSGDPNSDIFLFIWTDDSSSLVYAGDDLIDGVTELFISNVSGATPTPPVRLSAPMTNLDGDVGTSMGMQVPADFGLSPDGTKLFYIADARTESVDELYVVDLATPGVARLVSHDGRTDTGDDVDRAYWTPDSQNLVFVADTQTSLVLEVFLADATGAGSPLPVALNAPFVTNGDVSQGTASFSTEEVIVHPENRGVFYMADGETDAVEVVYYSAFIAPGAMTNVSSNVAGASDVNSFLLSRTGSLLVYNADPTASAVDELFSVDTSGPVFGAPLQVNGTLVTNGDCGSLVSTTTHDYDIVGEGEAVIYIADQITDVVDQPFYTPINAGVPGTSVELITPVTNGDTYQVYR